MGLTNTISERNAERGIGQFIVYVLVALFFVAAGIHWRSKQHTDRIDVQGTKYLAAGEVIGMIDSTAADTSIAKVKLADLRMQIMKHPFVKSASVQRQGARNLTISVTERTPLAVLLSNDGSMHYVDEQYVVMPYRIVQTVGDVPVIRGLMQGNTIDSSRMKSIVDVLIETQRNDDGMLYRDISEVKCVSGSDAITLTTAESGTTIVFGSISNYTEKINALRAFYRYAGKQNNSRIRSVIDLRWKDRIILRNSES